MYLLCWNNSGKTSVYVLSGSRSTTLQSFLYCPVIPAKETAAKERKRLSVYVLSGSRSTTLQSFLYCPVIPARETAAKERKRFSVHLLSKDMTILLMSKRGPSILGSNL